MNRRLLAVSLFGAALAVAAVPLAGLAAEPQPAQGGAQVQGPANVSSLAAFMDPALRWGMSHDDLTAAFNRPGGIFDNEYAPRLAKMQPGSQMEMVEADRNNRKAALAGSFVRFLDDPLGFDSTPIHTEYTYKNNESLQWVRRLGTKEYFFFFGAPPNTRFWKAYSEVPLRPGGQLGPTFEDALHKIVGILGTMGRIRAAGTDGLDATTVDWQDASTHMRVIDRSGEHIVAVVLEERATLDRLAQLRANKPFDPFALDPSTAAVTRHGVSDPNSHPAPSASASGNPPPRH